MPAVTIKRLRKLKNAASFVDFPPPPETIEFYPANLIYGFNGSGKTTLSRIFEGLRINGDTRNLPIGCQCEVELSDGSIVVLGQDPSVTAIGSRIAVFNEDFVQRTLAWSSGEAVPITYIGEAQTEIAQQIERGDAELAAARQQDEVRSAEWSAAERELRQLRTSVASQVASECHLGRNYTATHLKSDFSNTTFGPDDFLDDNALRDVRETVNKGELGSRIEMPVLTNNLPSLAAQISACLSETVEQFTLETLEHRPDAAPWLAVGLNLHGEETSCLFCDQVLPQGRIEQLRQALSESFDKLGRSISTSIDSCRNELRALSIFRERAPTNFGDVFPSVRAEMISAISAASEITKRCEETVNLWIKELERKSARSNEMVQLPDTWQSLSIGVDQAISDLKTVFEKYHEEFSNFSALKETARTKLKRHLLARVSGSYLEAESRELEAKNAYDETQAEMSRKSAEISRLKEQLKEHAPAADELNRLLKSYLGHDGIQLRVVDQGYEICRYGEVAIKPLSEGEKTAISFCYFLVYLNSLNLPMEELIIVVDDPISSLDNKSISYVFSLLKSKMSKAAQLFIMTHNLDFLRENKKWLDRRYRDENNKSAEFLFVESSIDEDEKKRARLILLPSLIAEYESEYHYLYSLVYGLVEKQQDFKKFLYLMPNVMRKTLEIFLAFKLPGTSGLSDKIEQLIRADNSLDENKLRALDRLVQLESHADNIGDVVGLSAFTLEQAADYAGCLLKVIDQLDHDHRLRMDKLAKRALAKAA